MGAAWQPVDVAQTMLRSYAASADFQRVASGRLNMRREIIVGVKWIGIGLALCVATAIPQRVSARTPISDAIRAEADYVAAQGYYAESTARAREIHAEAAAIEIDNWVKHVKAYYERKAIWKEEWQKEHPSMYEREKKIQELWDRRIREQYQDLLKADVTEQLNWLLGETSAPALAAKYLPADQNLPAEQTAELNMPLTERDIDQIWLTDGGRGGRFIFRLAEPKMLETPWPWALRAPEFKEARDEFEAASQAVVRETKDSKDPLSYEGGSRLLNATNQLLVALKEAYPDDRRREPAVFLEYKDSERYLQTLVLRVMRVIKTDDRSLFKDDLRFHGKTLSELIQYMSQNGLLFAKSPNGGEGVYARLFCGLRNVYVILGPDKSAALSEKRASELEKPAGERNSLTPFPFGR